MASVEQAKDALEVEREHAAQMTDRALSAIDSVVAISSHTITAIGVIATLIALIGGIAIYIASRDMARRVAKARIDAYIRTAEGQEFVRGAISEEVRIQFENKIVVTVRPDDSHIAGASFPPPPQTGGSI